MKNLKNSLGELVDVENQLHNSKEQFSVIDSGTLPHNLLLILCDTT